MKCENCKKEAAEHVTGLCPKCRLKVVDKIADDILKDWNDREAKVVDINKNKTHKK